MSPSTAIQSTTSSTAITSAAAAAETFPTTKANNKFNTRELVKTANLLTAKSTMPMAKLPNSPSSSLPSISPSPLPLSTLPSSSSSSLPIASETAATAFEAISLALITPTKIDPYAVLSFASAASTTSVTMARMTTNTIANTNTKNINTNTTSTMKDGIVSYHNVIAMLTLLFLLSGLAGVDGLKCYMCGQYNEGVGSITPCLNYSESIRHLYLKDCLKSSEKYCVKYVSELSTVRDCATECAEKEVWETQTYCCNTDGCNGAGNLQISMTMLLLPLLYFIYRALKIMLKTQH